MNNRLVRQLALIPVLVLCAAVLFWLLLPVFVSTDFVRGAIEREITGIAGQRVWIGRTTDVSLFPTPSARLENVIVRAGAQRPDATDEDAVATIGAIDIEMSLGSLVTGQPRLSSIHLVDPVIRLRNSTDGEGLNSLPMRNVATAVRLTRQQREASQSENAEGTPLAPMTDAAVEYPDWLDTAVGTITFSNAIIQGFDGVEAGQPVWQADQATGRLSWPRFGQPLVLEGTFRLNGETVTASYRTANPIVALSGQITDAAVEASSELGNLSFDGNAGAEGGFYALGNLQFDTQSLRQLLRWRGENVRPALGLGAINLSATMQARGSSIRLDDLTIDVDGNTGTGVVEFRETIDALPSLIGTLDFASLDLRDFFSAFVPLPDRLDARRNIDTRFMDQLQTDLRVSAATASFGELALQDVAATAQTTRDIALFDVGDASAFGGRLQGRLRFERTDDTPTVEMSIAGERTDLTEAKLALPLPPVLPAGIADFSVDLSAELGQWRTLFSSPDGQFSLRMAEGTLPGLDPGILADIQAARGFHRLELDPSDADPFASLNWTGAIENGEMGMDGLSIDYDTDRLAFTGVIQLATRSLALTADDLSTGENGGLKGRFFIGGGVNAPYVYPVPGAPVTSPEVQ